MMPERYYRHRTTGPLDGLPFRREPPSCAVKSLGSVSPDRRRWRRALRAGLFWTALGLGAASISYACDADLAARSLGFDRAVSALFFALVPIPALALGVRGLALSLRLQDAARLADGVRSYLSEHLPDGFVVVAHYHPHDGADDEIPLLVIGPDAVTVVQPRADEGVVRCYEDHWYRERAYGVGRRVPGTSVSQIARWNASRVRQDLASGGFTRTRVEPLVLFTRARLGDVSSSSVPAVAGLDGAIAQLCRTASLGSQTDRARAVASALVGLAVA
jgi:hypothetical protein